MRAFADWAVDRVDAGREVGVESGRVAWLQGVGERLPDALSLEHEAVWGSAVVDDGEADRPRRQLRWHLDRKIGQADVDELRRGIGHIRRGGSALTGRLLLGDGSTCLVATTWAIITETLVEPSAAGTR